MTNADPRVRASIFGAQEILNGPCQHQISPVGWARGLEPGGPRFDSRSRPFYKDPDLTQGES